ncbi:hypothetical protein SUGI_0451300 [Cryptomeria japonica]|nr:hypothetical protein SUGI_0451300 [Cryptomeria japonica]
MRGSFSGVIRGLNKIICGNLRDPTDSHILQNTLIQGSFRKCVHSSVYEKNEDVGVHLDKVPDEIIQPATQKSWVPHPKTGVFGPAEEQSWTGGNPNQSPEKIEESVLEQQVWFRPSEGLEKQPYN